MYVNIDVWMCVQGLIQYSSLQCTGHRGQWPSLHYTKQRTRALLYPHCSLQVKYKKYIKLDVIIDRLQYTDSWSVDVSQYIIHSRCWSMRSFKQLIAY